MTWYLAQRTVGRLNMVSTLSREYNKHFGMVSLAFIFDLLVTLCKLKLAAKRYCGAFGMATRHFNLLRGVFPLSWKDSPVWL